MLTKHDVQIVLQPYEYAMAANVGSRRVLTAIYKNSERSHGFNKGHGWSEHIEGACAEMVVAKYKNVYWNGSNGTYKTSDLASLTEIRHTERADGKLIIRTDDKSERQFVLVTGLCPTYTIRGYIKAIDAKVDKYLTNFGDDTRPMVWGVPQTDLWDIATLEIS